ncbi:hypothetical protein [Joostella sp.]|uniref:hypothetical protein n=1 Tax=Joostella sp. TaxID=2231138 RepID=UPI003A8CA591
MSSSYGRITIVIMFFLWKHLSFSQSLEHPVIWVTQDEKQHVLALIDQYDWANSLVKDLHKAVDEKVDKHINDPDAILFTIPQISDDSNLTEFQAKTVEQHTKVLTEASYAAILYFLTEKEKYAQFSADILWYYTDVLVKRNVKMTTICGNKFYDPRTTYAKFAITYDFIYNFLKEKKTKVYKSAIKRRVPVDNEVFQKVILNMIGSTLQEYGPPDQHGKFVSNHPILTAPGVLFGILCVEDDQERNRLFNIFWEQGTAHQNSFKNTILPMFGKQGVWPESTSYSFMPIVTLILNVIDRVYPEMDVTKDYKKVFNGNFLFDNLRMPDGRFVRYGDSKRNHDGTQELYRYTLEMAQRRGYEQLKNQAQVALRQAYDAEGGYNPKLRVSGFDNFDPLQLFWGVPVTIETNSQIDFKKPTVVVEHAGIALQRNYVEKDNELYGLCGIIGGAHYVHSHVTGITMELYGAGYVMAPNAGLPPTVKERRIPLHENYFRLYAGNNTVIVNGSSHGNQPGSWKDGAYVWQNRVVNVASEPKHLEDPITENFNFATQFLRDTVNNCIQERTLSTIRTSERTGYYLDVFRSKSLDENKFHDYIYHNLGDTLLLEKGNHKPIQTHFTSRYQNDIGDAVQSPGWRYFENTSATEFITDAITAKFQITYDNKFMNMFVPKGIERSYTIAEAPATREAKNGYDSKPTKVLVIRQNGEAWDRPFITVYEPSIKSQSSVLKVSPLKDGEKTVGASVISKADGKVITDHIISLDDKDASYSNKKLKIEFKGRLGIVRVVEENEKKKVSIYIGEGKILKYKSYVLAADNNDKVFKEY